MVITTDALLTQRKFCQEILGRQADYCLPVKANQKQLYEEDIRDLFESFEETDPQKLNTDALQTFTQKSAHTFRRIPTQNTQKGGLPRAPYKMKNRTIE